MTLQEAIRTAVGEFGSSVLTEERLVAILMDYRALGDRAVHHVVRLMVEDGYMQRLLAMEGAEQDERQTKCAVMAYEMTQRYGLQRRLVNGVVNGVACGLGWVCDENGALLSHADNGDEADYATLDVYGIEIKFIAVEGGSFEMGATMEQGVYAAYDEKPAMAVSVDDFYMAQTAVTQELWEAVMGANPSFCRGGHKPVERVSWEECQTFIQKVNDLTQCMLRMPTEAEWEYAARGGRRRCGHRYAGCDADRLTDYAWYADNAGDVSREVGRLSPNELGLYDMSGGVWEWCEDWYHSGYLYGGALRNPHGPQMGVSKVCRGGCYAERDINCRVSKRNWLNPQYRDRHVGLRLAASRI